MRNSRRVLFGVDQQFDLGQLELPEGIGEGRYKYRLPYGRTLGAAAISSYKPRILSSLVVVEPDHFEYPLKFADRTRFERLRRRAGLSELDASDDILIVVGGLLTDTSYSNVALFNGRTWVTPSHPLLDGVKRAELLHRSAIEVADIRLSELQSYETLSIVNAMLDLGEIVVPVGSIIIQ